MFLTSESNLKENPFHITIFIELIMNTVPRQKGFGEANKVYNFDVLLQNPKCRNLCVTNTSMFYDPTSFTIFFGPVTKHCERPSLHARGLASLLETRSPCERPVLP